MSEEGGEEECSVLREGNQVKGWNDPPEMKGNVNSGGKKTTTTVLNQRVAHSFNGPPTTTTASVPPAPLPGGEPPMSEPPKLFAPPVSFTTSTGSKLTTRESRPSEQEQEQEQEKEKEKEIIPNSSDAVEEIEKILNERLEQLHNQSNTSCNDILKRVKIFVTKWPKLGNQVKVRMLKLAKALEKEELKTADELHVSIMLDYPSEVSLWMVGIKKLIHELISLEAEKKKSQQQQTEEENK